MRRPAACAAAAVLALAAGPAGGVELDDPEAEPLRFAAETLSGDAVTAGADGDAIYHDLRAPAGTALSSTMKLSLSARDGWYLRVDLDGMVFSATPALATAGDGAGSGFESDDAVAGGAGEAFAVYRLPAGTGFARDITFSLLVAEALAVPAGEGEYGAAMALYNEFGDALDREDALTYSAFGGEATVVVVTSGVAVGIESGFAAVGFQDDFEGFVPESASGSSTDADNPSAPAVLGSVSVGAVAASAGRPTVRSARTGAPVTAADVIESVAVAVEGDMTFGTLDFRTGTARDRCLRTGTGTDGGVLPLAPPVGEDKVTNRGDGSTDTTVYEVRPSVRPQVAR